jgi:hypothetical protein
MCQPGGCRALSSWRADNGNSKAEYHQKCARLDEQYAHLLQLAIDAARAAQAATPGEP